MNWTILLGSLMFSLSNAQGSHHAGSNPLRGDDIPLLGFGTWNLKNATDVVSDALQLGYRHLDCAAIYGNEKDVGRGIQQGLAKSGLERQSIWVTSKLWNNMHPPDRVPLALNRTLADLGLDYLDLYLMHWPVSSEGGTNKIDYIDTWHAMHDLLSTGLVRHIGISNFSPAQLKDLMTSSKVTPFAHQMELHPYLQQADWVKYHQTHNIHVTAYSPFGNINPTYNHSRKGQVAGTLPPLLETDLIEKIAKKRGCTTAQVALAWGMGRDTSVIPKSAHERRMKENKEAATCKLHKDDYGKIADGLPVKRFNDPSKSYGVDLFKGLPDAASEDDASLGSRLQSMRQNAGSFWTQVWRYVVDGRDL